MIESSPSSDTHVVHVTARQPFDFAHTLAFLGRFPATAGEQGVTGTSLSCAVRAAGALAGVRIAAEDDGLRYELSCARGLDEQTVAAFVDRLSFFLGTDDDVGAFYALAADDAPFRAVVRRLYGYHQVKFPSPLELLVWAILGQRVPMPVARKMKQAIVGRFDNRVATDGVERWAFPDLAQLLTLEVEDYVELIANPRKAGYLTGAVRGWAQLDEAFLRHGDEAAVREQLLALPGVGPWSASFVMIRGLGRLGTLTPDKEAKRAASRVYGHPIEDLEFAQLADHYGSWKGYWSHYLRAGDGPW